MESVDTVCDPLPVRTNPGTLVSYRPDPGHTVVVDSTCEDPRVTSSGETSVLVEMLLDKARAMLDPW